MAPTTDASSGPVLPLTTPVSDRVAAARIELLSAATLDPLELGTFTDEEMVALEDPAGSPRSPSPWLATRSPDEVRLAIAVALRGLTARGLYRAADEPGGEISFEADPDLLALVSLRRSVSALVVAERRIDSRTEWILLYVQHGGLWLGERVTDTGLHDFTLGDVAHWTDSMTGWCGVEDDRRPAPVYEAVVPPDAADGELPGVVARSRTATLISRFDARPGHEPREAWSALYTGPGGYYRAEHAADGVLYTGTAGRDVRRHWLASLTPPPDAS